jgi:glutathione S-transferase
MTQPPSTSPETPMAPPAPPLTLYGDHLWTSPYVFSCYVGLAEKQLEFATVAVSLDRREQRRPEYLERAITGKVPALAHGHFWLTESSAILEYLDEAFPGTAPLLPEAVEERARARQVMSWLRTDLEPLRQERPSSTLFYERATGRLGDAAQEAAEKLVNVAGVLVTSDRPDLLGRWCIADADLAFMLQRLILNGHPVPPRLRDYAARQWSRPSVRAYLERERPSFTG